jgi:hypothetical protein
MATLWVRELERHWQAFTRQRRATDSINTQVKVNNVVIYFSGIVGAS